MGNVSGPRGVVYPRKRIGANEAIGNRGSGFAAVWGMEDVRNEAMTAKMAVEMPVSNEKK